MFVSQIFDEIAEILGTTDQPKIFRKLTQAVQTLMESGHWFHSTAEIDICTGWDGLTVTLPRGIEVPLAVNVDGSPIYFRNRLFQYHVNKGGKYNPVEWAWDDRGFQATMMEIVQPSQLIAVAESDNDVGKELRIIGTDSNNRIIRSQTEDGHGVDGLLIPIHSISDFQYGTIQPDGLTVRTRDAGISPITKFKTAVPHTLDSGQPMAVTPITGTLPVPLSNGQIYYIGVIDALTIQLYNDQLNAVAGEYPIELQSIVGSGNIQLLDKRASAVVTALRFLTAPDVAIDSANQITFPPQLLPAPLKTGVTYFANLIDPLNLQIFNSIQDATNATNEINTTGSTATINVDIRKPIAPQTKLTFNLPHYFATGDQVQATTNGGVLPQPLISGNSYYVRVLDPLTVTLHPSATDAFADTNSVNMVTAGSGTNALVKLIPASVAIGTQNNILAEGLNLPAASGSGATAVGVPSGIVTSLNIDDQGTGYTTAPTVTISDIGGGGYRTNQVTVTAIGTNTQPAIFSTEVTDGTITAINVVDGGEGYSPATTIRITDSSGTNQGRGAVGTITGFGPLGEILGISLNPVGSGASATASINNVTNVVNGLVLNSPGEGYVVPPRINIARSDINVATGKALIDTGLGKVTSVIITSQGSGYTVAPTVKFIGGGGSGAAGTATLTGSQVLSVTITNQGSGYTSSPIVVFDGGGGTGPNTKYTGARGSSTITTSFLELINVVNPGTGYINAPAVTISGGGGSGATATAVVQGGQVTAINVITKGTGYSAAPTITLTASTGVFVSFTTTGTFPNPLIQGASYRAEEPFSPTSFTAVNVDYTPVNITSVGTGQFYVLLSRPFGVGWTNKWAADFSGLPVAPVEVYFGTDFQLPVTTPPIDNGVTAFWMNIDANRRLARIYNNQTNANAGTTTGQIQVLSFGTGQSYYAIRTPMQSLPYGNRIEPSSIQYIQENEVVEFSSSGTLPSPLLAGTEYTVKVVGDDVQVYLGGVLVPIATPGVGQLSMDIRRTVTVDPSTRINAVSSLYETGQALTVRPKDNDSLPVPLVTGTSYYVRKISSDSFELYATKAQALNLASTAGRISYLTTGNKVSSTFVIDAVENPIFVKSIEHIEKPITDGFVSLYAYDYGRANDMTLIGQYHPSEVNPKYRRIRIGKKCAWARIIYRIQAPNITSIYDYIPIEQERALIAAVHAVDLEDKDFADQATRYWGIAVNYLRNQQESMDGHAMTPPQINNITYGDGTDPVMM